jgi:hypothetical protein
LTNYKVVISEKVTYTVDRCCYYICTFNMNLAPAVETPSKKGTCRATESAEVEASSAAAESFTASSSAPEAAQPSDLPVKILRELGPSDILLGRGALAIRNPGNVNFGRIVGLRKGEYKSTSHRRTKDTIARQVMQAVRNCNGRFVRKIEGPEEMKLHGIGENENAWMVVDDAAAILKVKQSLRDKESTRTSDYSVGRRVHGDMLDGDEDSDSVEGKQLNARKRQRSVPSSRASLSKKNVVSTASHAKSSAPRVTHGSDELKKPPPGRVGANAAASDSKMPIGAPGVPKLTVTKTSFVQPNDSGSSDGNIATKELKRAANSTSTTEQVNLADPNSALSRSQVDAFPGVARVQGYGENNASNDNLSTDMATVQAMLQMRHAHTEANAESARSVRDQQTLHSNAGSSIPALNSIGANEETLRNLQMLAASNGSRSDAPLLDSVTQGYLGLSQGYASARFSEGSIQQQLLEIARTNELQRHLERRQLEQQILMSASGNASLLRNIDAANALLGTRSGGLTDSQYNTALLPLLQQRDTHPLLSLQHQSLSNLLASHQQGIGSAMGLQLQYAQPNSAMLTLSQQDLLQRHLLLSALAENSNGSSSDNDFAESLARATGLR